MTQILKIQPGERVLEIGTGSGYQAAVLAELTDQVFTVEIIELDPGGPTAEGVGIRQGPGEMRDGYFGWGGAPFDAIIVTCAANHIPFDQAAERRGRLIIPLGSTTYFQTLTLLYEKMGKRHPASHGVAFVPMTGEARKVILPIADMTSTNLGLPYRSSILLSYLCTMLLWGGLSTCPSYPLIPAGSGSSRPPAW
jgi:protein-L-isoaspartate(D-aspartate) O-methyltransferase